MLRLWLIVLLTLMLVVQACSDTDVSHIEASHATLTNRVETLEANLSKDTVVLAPTSTLIPTYAPATPTLSWCREVREKLTRWEHYETAFSDALRQQSLDDEESKLRDILKSVQDAQVHYPPLQNQLAWDLILILNELDGSVSALHSALTALNNDHDIALFRIYFAFHRIASHQSIAAYSLARFVCG